MARPPERQLGIGRPGKKWENEEIDLRGAIDRSACVRVRVGRGNLGACIIASRTRVCGRAQQTSSVVVLERVGTIEYMPGNGGERREISRAPSINTHRRRGDIRCTGARVGKATYNT